MMKAFAVALAATLLGTLVNSPAFSQAKCTNSCSNSKNVCNQNTQGNRSDLCESRFKECMATGTWVRTDRSGTRVFQNICKR